MTTTAFEVAALFRLVDEMSPQLKKIFDSVAALNKEIKAVRDSLSGFSGVVAPGISGAITQVNELTAAWERVGAASKAAAASAAASARGAAAAAAGGAGGGAGAGRRGLGAYLAGGGPPAGVHVGGPSVPIPGGSHVRFGGPATVAAGVLAYAVAEDVKIEDAIAQLIYHSGQKNTKPNQDRFRKIIEDAQKSTGFGLHDITEAALQDVRMFKGTPGGGVDALPEVLNISATEARLKGTPLKESVTAFIGLAHMLGSYSPAEIKALAPMFAFMSSADPRSLVSQERAASYAVPILKSGLEVDPTTALLLGTALARAGVTSTKSGTWLRELGVRGLPGGTDKHDEALKRLKLEDAEGKPTWFVDGKPNIEKLLAIGGAAAAQIPVAERSGVITQGFGRQGGGAFSVLTAQAVLDQIKKLREEMESQEYKNRYSNFMESYEKNSPLQKARTVLQEFNVSMQNLGDKALPGATAALSAFSAVLRGLNFINDATPKGNKPIGLPMQRSAPRAFEHFFGPKEGDGALKPQPQSYDGGPMTPQRMNFLQGPPTTPKPQPISLSLNVDGRQLAQTVSEVLADLTEHATSAPSYNGLQAFNRADGGIAAV